MSAWYDSPFTGLFRRFGPIATRPHDPDVSICSGELPAWGPRIVELMIGGVGWDAAAAEAACVGEAVERVQVWPLPRDQSVPACFDAWPQAEPAVPPERWVLFHPEQYAQPGFPFEPLASRTVCRWVCCREARTGQPWWVPEELVFLDTRAGERHRFGPAISTGLSCGRPGQPVLLRGLQEVIERDAVVGAWWGSYGLEEWEAGAVFDLLGSETARRVRRPNLHYRFYRAVSPFSAHVTLVTVEGDDREGYCFSAGSACRETRRTSWEKALLEAIHGRAFVRYLLPQREGDAPAESGGQARREPRAPDPGRLPRSFAEHAVYYNLHSGRRSRTVLEHAQSPTPDFRESMTESVPLLAERLGPDRPVLFRDLTPPGLAQAGLDGRVLRVLVPGLQPLHGDHLMPFLGGPHWAGRALADWDTVPPHPFP